MNVAVGKWYVAVYAWGRWRHLNIVPLLIDAAAWIVLGFLIFGAGALFHAGWQAVQP